MATQEIQQRTEQRLSPRDQARFALTDMLRGRSNEVLQLLPGTFGSDVEKKEAVARFLRQLIMATDKNLALLDCSPASFFSAALALAACGLDPSGNNGESAIVPFKGVATPMVMARGYVMMAIRSGAAKAIDHGVVCEGDQFDYELGTNAYIRHRPALNNRGEAVAVWCFAVLPTGEKIFEVMGWDEVEAIRARSRSANNGPWVTDPLEMGRKTVLRRIMKRIPWNSDDLMDRLVSVQKAEDGAFGLPDLKPADSAPQRSGLAGLRDLASKDAAPALSHQPAQDASKLADGSNPQAEPVRVASTPQSVAAPAKQAGPTCPRCKNPVEPQIADEVLRLGNCPACAPKR